MAPGFREGSEGDARCLGMMGMMHSAFWLGLTLEIPLLASDLSILIDLGFGLVTTRT